MLMYLIIIPIIGIFIIQFFGKTPKIIYIIGLTTSIQTFIQANYLYYFMDYTIGNFQYISLEGLLGIDGLSISLILLTTFLIPITILASWKSINTQRINIIIFIQFLEFILIGVFSVLDIFLFYICFETVLIPLFFIIGLYGTRKRKINAIYQLFIYTIFGSLFILLAILIQYFETGTTNYQLISPIPISYNRQLLLWLMFFQGFAIKIPMVPFHIWLPEAHVEAPTIGSVILAGVILKLGGYGFQRINIPLFPDANLFFTPFVYGLAIIGIQYSSLCCLAQVDIKKIIAYSSIGHMNSSLQGLFSNNIYGIQGSIFFMITHGLISSGLFLLIGILYDRYHTRTILYYRGLVLIMPLFILCFFIFSMANIAFPGTGAFISEFLTFLGAFQNNPIITLQGTIVIPLAPCYAQWFYHQISFGSFSPYLPHIFSDITLKEFNILLPQIFFIFLLGIFPNFLLESILFSSLYLLN